MNQTITITDVSGNRPTTIPVSPRIPRESSCRDLIIITAVHIGCPINVRLSLRTDGSIAVWDTIFDGPDGTYAHVDPDMYGDEDYNRPNAPTEAQRRTVARWWGGVEKPCGLYGGVGSSLLEWAFAGMDKAEVEEKYLDGMHVMCC